MRVRFYIDPETGLSHIYKLNITETEIEAVLVHPGEDRPGREGTRVVLGQTNMKENSFPIGWDEKRVHQVISYYEEQPEAEAVAEDEAAYEQEGF